MTFDLTNDDRDAMKEFAALILDAYKEGRIEKLQAVSTLTEAMALATYDSERAFRSFVRSSLAKHYGDWPHA